mgnify:FL=1
MPFKDTKSGSTHYYNDGCGEPAHNDNDLREEFEKRFSVRDDETGMHKTWADRSDGQTIADWWISKFVSLRQKEMEELVKRVEGIKKDNAEMFIGTDEQYVTRGFNRAIEDFLSILTDETK